MTTHSQARTPGTPCWADLAPKDVAKTSAFYTEIFGWEYTEGEEQYNYYSNATKDGRTVVGMSPQPPGADMPVFWTIYLATDDVAMTTKKAVEAGGTSIMEPMQVGPFGHMALVQDTTGAMVGFWQGGDHLGYQVTDEPGTITWTDYMCHNLDDARPFYKECFGYDFKNANMSGMTYDFVNLGDDTVAGMGEYDKGQENIPAAWTITFEVEDMDATVAKIVELGGGIVSKPVEFEFGRMAIVTGLEGEVFGLRSPGAAE